MTISPQSGTTVHGKRRFLSPLLDDLAARRAQRAQRRSLAESISNYRTPAEIDELLAVLGREEGSSVEEMRTMLIARRAGWDSLKHAA